MPDRRFNEDEVAAIIQRATEAQDAPPPKLSAGDGLTLAEIQDIGREVGVAPDVIARAAAAIDQAGKTSTRKLLGLPIEVGQTAELGRRVSDEEWERFVADLRETFDAPGRVWQDGTLREWRNGNLVVTLEPTATGDRVRMRTAKQSARSLLAGGAVVSGLAVVSTVAALGAGHAVNVGFEGLLALIGAGLLGTATMQLAPWARLRRQQMKELAERLASGESPEV